MGELRSLRLFLGKRPVGRRLLALVTILALGTVDCAGPTEAPEPPDGGIRYDLSYEVFAAEVVPLLDELGCSAVGDCHGGGIRGSYRLSPVDDKDVERDFEESALQVYPFALDESPLLRKPLREEAGGSRHEFQPFENTGDARYRVLRAWVHGGTYR